MAVPSYLLGRRGQDDSRTLGPRSGALDAGVFLVGISLSASILFSPSQSMPTNPSTFLNSESPVTTVALSYGGGYGKAVGIGYGGDRFRVIDVFLI